MLDGNVSKVTWVAVAVGIVAILGIGSMVLFPDAISTMKTTVTNEVQHFSNYTPDADTADNFTYSLDTDKNEATITDWSGKDGSVNDATVTVPGSIVRNHQNYKVVGIRSGGFLGNASLKTVKLPDGLRSVGSAFLVNAPNLTSLNVPSSLTQDSIMVQSSDVNNAVPAGFIGMSLGQSSIRSGNLNHIDVPTSWHKGDVIAFCSNLYARSVSNATNVDIYQGGVRVGTAMYTDGSGNVGYFVDSSENHYNFSGMSYSNSGYGGFGFDSGQKSAPWVASSDGNYKNYYDKTTGHMILSDPAETSAS